MGLVWINMLPILRKMRVYLQTKFSAIPSPRTEEFEGKKFVATSLNFLEHMYNPYSFVQPKIMGCTEQHLGYQQNCNQQYQASQQQYGNYYHPQPWLFNQQQLQHHGLGPYNFLNLPDRPNLDSVSDTAIPNVFASASSEETAPRHDYTTSNRYLLSYQLKQHNQQQDTVGMSTFLHISDELIS